MALLDAGGSFAKGVDRANNMLQIMASRAAGSKLASGDQQGAENELLKVGDLGGARTLQKNVLDDRYAATQDDRAERNTVVNEGNYDLNRIKTEHQMDDDAFQKSLEFVEDTATMLHGVLKTDGPEGVMAAFDQIKPMLEARAGSPEQVAQYREMLAQNPEQFLTMLMDQVQKDKKAHILAPGSQLRDDKGNLLAQAPFTPKTVTASQGSTVFMFDPNNPKGDGVPATPEAKFDDFYTRYLAPVEGGMVAEDGRSGAPANFGINQAANPDIDVANLTQDEAKKVLYDRYYVRSGADKLPPALSAIHADTAVNAGVETAQRMLQASGGDPEKYLKLREDYYKSLGQPENEENWMNRNAKLTEYVGSIGGAPGLTKVAEGAPKTTKQFVDMSAEEKKSAGIPESVAAQRDLSTGEIKVPYKPTAGGTIKLSTKDAAELSEARENLRKTQETSTLFKEFIDLNANTATGGVGGAPMVRDARAAFDKDFGRMTSIQDNVTPGMRQGLPGAASDRDVAMFRSAAVNVGRPYEANLMTYEAFQAKAKREAEYVEFKEAYALKNNTLLGAQELWNDYANSNSILADDATAENMKLNPNAKGWREAIPGFSKSEEASKGRVLKWNKETGKLE